MERSGPPFLQSPIVWAGDRVRRRMSGDEDMESRKRRRTDDGPPLASLTKEESDNKDKDSQMIEVLLQTQTSQAEKDVSHVNMSPPTTMEKVAGRRLRKTTVKEMMPPKFTSGLPETKAASAPTSPKLAPPPQYHPLPSNMRLCRRLRYGRIFTAFLLMAFAVTAFLHQTTHHRPLDFLTKTILSFDQHRPLDFLTKTTLSLYRNKKTRPRLHNHIIPPRHVQNVSQDSIVAGLTLRKVLEDPEGIHLAMAPAFFGFYGYFGALMAWEQELGDEILTHEKIKSVAGGSAGAMAAILLAAGISPAKAAAFCQNITVDEFADFPGIGAFFRGNKFERILFDFLKEQRPDHSLLLEDAELPVAVSAFDLQTMDMHILKSGSMARAARASATFPGLFQPVGWEEDTVDYMLIDGGIKDTAGVAGLSSIVTDQPKRVVNLKVEDFFGGVPPGPSKVPESDMVVSVTLRNLPNCGPWAMANGPRALLAAAKAMAASLDVPLYRGEEEYHYELHIDTSSFWNSDTSNEIEQE